MSCPEKPNLAPTRNYLNVRVPLARGKVPMRHLAHQIGNIHSAGVESWEKVGYELRKNFSGEVMDA